MSSREKKSAPSRVELATKKLVPFIHTHIPFHNDSDWIQWLHCSHLTRMTSSRLVRIESYSLGQDDTIYIIVDYSMALSATLLTGWLSCTSGVLRLKSRSVHVESLLSFMDNSQQAMRTFVCADLQNCQWIIRYNLNSTLDISSSSFIDLGNNMLGVRFFPAPAQSKPDLDTLSFEQLQEQVSAISTSLQFACTNYHSGIATGFIIGTDNRANIEDLKKRIGNLTEASIRPRLALRFGANWPEHVNIHNLNNLVEYVGKGLDIAENKVLWTKRNIIDKILYKFKGWREGGELESWDEVTPSSKRKTDWSDGCIFKNISLGE